MRRPQPGHSPSLLIDQDWRIIAANGLAQRRDQLTDLRGSAAVASEKDETNRIGNAKETVLFSGQLLAGATE